MPAPVSIKANKGRSFLIKLGTGTSPETYTTITGLRMTGIVINGNSVDITNKSSQGWQELLAGAGVRSVDITASGIYDATIAGTVATLVQAALDGGTILAMEIVTDSNDTFIGWWSVQTVKRDGPYNNAETIDYTLKSHGVISYFPG